jgi:hypothetical protein
MASRRPPESMASPPINRESEGALEWTPPVLLSAVKVRSMRRKKSKHPGTVRLELQQKLKASRKSRSAKLHRNHFRFASVCKNLRKPTPRINVQGSSHSSSSRLTSSIARLSFFCVRLISSGMPSRTLLKPREATQTLLIKPTIGVNKLSTFT